MRVFFSPTGRRQFLDAIAYIQRDNLSAAVNFHERAKMTFFRLKKSPESGRVIPKFPDLPFREVIVGPYRFFYRIKGDTIWIVAAWHSAQLPEEPDIG
ncbi:MAG: type II toxin-antitoxin system RelE/ParE family toxin [Deltaproteobacteria bacterium]|nr:type II toxin-antitoxin system RelE/ParE family toxin [Deltaproteobacteria bacterium]